MITMKRDDMPDALAEWENWESGGDPDIYRDYREETRTVRTLTCNRGNWSGAEIAVEIVEQRNDCGILESTIPEILANVRPVLLFDVGVIVFVIRP